MFFCGNLPNIKFRAVFKKACCGAIVLRVARDDGPAFIGQTIPLVFIGAVAPL